MTQRPRPLSDMARKGFLVEIEHRCHDAMIAAAILDNALQTSDTNVAWFGLRSVIMASSSISQLTGRGDSPTLRVQRQAIRTALGIDNQSVLHRRAVRDAAEHVDTRILKAEREGRFKGYVGYNIGPRGGIVIQGMPADQFLLHYDPTTGVVSFWGDEVSIPEVLAEVRRILPLVQAALRQ
jgi:hypothetical protein